MTERSVCRAVLHFPGHFRNPCVLNAGHPGNHQHADGDAWTVTFQEREEFPGGGESVSQRLDRVLLGVREEIRALADHMAKEIATVRVSSAIPVYRAPEGEGDGNYLHGRTHGDLIWELFKRISKLESRLNPVCGDRDPSSGRVCQRPPDHYGVVHRDMISDLRGDSTVWSTGHQIGRKTQPGD